MKRITITFDGDQIQTDAQGFEGKNCVSETEKILEELGATLQERKLKPEYNKAGVREKSL